MATWFRYKGFIFNWIFRFCCQGNKESDLWPWLGSAWGQGSSSSVSRSCRRARDARASYKTSTCWGRRSRPPCRAGGPVQRWWLGRLSMDTAGQKKKRKKFHSILELGTINKFQCIKKFMLSTYPWITQIVTVYLDRHHMWGKGVFQNSE